MTDTTNELLGEELMGRLMNTFWEDRKINTDILELADRYELKADLPGFKKAEITIEYANDILTITARHVDAPTPAGHYLRKERAESTLTRKFVFHEINSAAISAQLIDGVLHLALPKQTGIKTIQIPID